MISSKNRNYSNEEISVSIKVLQIFNIFSFQYTITLLTLKYFKLESGLVVFCFEFQMMFCLLFSIKYVNIRNTDSYARFPRFLKIAQ